MIRNNIKELIGNTPLYKFNNLFKENNVYGKLEFFNLGGSIKDRMCFYAIEKHMKDGKIKKGDTIIIPTSGNAGIGMALACKYYRLKLICVLEEDTKKEKFIIKMIKMLGAEVIVTPLGKDYIQEAKKIHKNTCNSFMFDQFS